MKIRLKELSVGIFFCYIFNLEASGGALSASATELNPI